MPKTVLESLHANYKAAFIYVSRYAMGRSFLAHYLKQYAFRCSCILIACLTLYVLLEGGEEKGK